VKKLIQTLGLILLLEAPSAECEQFVEVHATIKYTNALISPHTGGLSDETNYSIAVRTVVGLNTWRIDNTYSENAEVGWLYDGTNIYHSTRIISPTSPETVSTARAAGLPVAPKHYSQSNITVRVYPSTNGLPIGDIGVNLPWLAYCSGPYLNQPSRTVPLPIGNIRHNPSAFGYTDSIECFQDELGLPIFVNLFTSGERVRESLVNFNRENLNGRDVDAIRKADLRVPEGQLKFSIKLNEATNFLGWNFPSEFVFLMRSQSPKGVWLTNAWGVGNIEFLAEAARPSGLFNSSLQQTIVDYRLEDRPGNVDAIIYTTTNSFLEPTNTKALQTALEKTRQQMQREVALPGRSRLVILVILFLLTMVPIVVAVIRHTVRNSKQAKATHEN
jgi:hypothetical protein